jgi:UDP-N-acetylglucosamine:LPS N-acetylglucosamine transferase
MLAHLASAKAVMATAGFTLISEALHLGKPYLAMPMKGQFEQELNGLLLADLGYGMASRRVTDDVIGHFLYRTPELAQTLEGFTREDNSALTTKLDELLADDCALAKAYHRKRSGS